MSKLSDNNKDLSYSLFWTIFAPIGDINDSNIEAIIEWLKDRSSVLIWFTSIITGSIVLLTLFGKKPGFIDPSSIALSISLLLMLFSILCNLICVWQIPKWKFAVRTGRISNGRRMTLDLEITSWIGLVSFLGALIMAVVGNTF
jgi:hypothetical protein